MTFEYFRNWVISRGKEVYYTAKENPEFNRIMKEVKKNPAMRRKRYLDVVNKQGTSQDFYSNEVFSELNKHYN